MNTRRTAGRNARTWETTTLGSSTRSWLAAWVNEWDEGTLIIGIVDPQSNELIWWGSANGELSKTKRPPDEAQRKADEVAAKILKGFPPGSEK